MADTAAPAAPAPTAPAPAAPAPSVPGTSTATAAPYKDAQAQTDAQNRAVLQALTSAGTAGTAGYTGQEQAGTADKGAAIQSLLGSAMFKGISGQSTGTNPATSPAPGIVAQAFDQRLGTDKILGDAFKAASGLREQGANTYFGEAKAAIPVIEARTNERIGMAHDRLAAAHQAAVDRANAAAQSQAISLQLKELALENALARSANGGRLPGQRLGGAPGSETVGKFITDNGGADLLGDQIKSLGDAARSDALRRSMNDSTTSWAQGNDWYGDAVVGTPLSPELARQLVANAAARDGSGQGVRSSGVYTDAVPNIVDGYNKGGTYEQFISNVTANVSDPVVQRQLIADYGPMFRQRDADQRRPAPTVQKTQ